MANFKFESCIYNENNWHLPLFTQSYSSIFFLLTYKHAINKHCKLTINIVFKHNKITNFKLRCYVRRQRLQIDNADYKVTGNQFTDSENFHH